MRVLMVEDEKHTARAVAEILKKNRYTVDLAHDGEAGLDFALSVVYELIILDIMLPKKDGLTVLKEVRQAGIDMTIPFLRKAQKGDETAVPNAVNNFLV